MSDLEKDFDEAAAQINEKLSGAAELIKEARLLGESHGLESLYISSYSERYDDLSEEDEEKLDKISWQELSVQLDLSGYSEGWNSSSC